MLSNLTKTRLQNLLNDLNRVVQTADRIIARLEAADALAEQVESYDRERGDFGGVWHALGEYRAAKSGACTNCGGRGYVTHRDRVIANEKDKSYVEFAERVANQVEELEMKLSMMMQSDSE